MRLTKVLVTYCTISTEKVTHIFLIICLVLPETEKALFTYQTISHLFTCQESYMNNSANGYSEAL